MEAEKSMVAKAVRGLREVLGESQEAFARRIGVAVRTVARWETVRPPKDLLTLVDLAELALRHGQEELFRAFATGGKPTFSFDKSDDGLRADRFVLQLQMAVEGPLVRHHDPHEQKAPPAGWDMAWEIAFRDAEQMLGGPEDSSVRLAFDRFAGLIRDIKSKTAEADPVPASNPRSRDDTERPQGLR